MLLLALLLPALAQPLPGDSEVAALAQALPGDAELAEIAQGLREVRALLIAANNRALSSEVDERLREIEAKLAALDAARFVLVDHAALLEADVVACTLPDGREIRARQQGGLEARAAPAPLPPPEPISRSELDRVQRAVGQARFGGDKIRVLVSAVRDRHLTVAQVREVMGWFNFGKDKVEAAAALHGRVIDPENWYLVYGSLGFENDKRALRQKVGD